MAVAVARHQGLHHAQVGLGGGHVGVPGWLAAAHVVPQAPLPATFASRGREAPDLAACPCRPPARRDVAAVFRELRIDFELEKKIEDGLISGAWMR